MDNFLAYLQQLELMAFFSGYPIIYTMVIFLAGMRSVLAHFKTRLISLLPIAYGLNGLLYLGLQLKNLYPDYSFEHIKQIVHAPYLMAWGIMSIFFWIPALAKKPILSLVHSLVFFIFIAKDLILQVISNQVEPGKLSNDMNVFTTSLLINLSTFIITVFLGFLYTSYKAPLKNGP